MLVVAVVAVAYGTQAPSLGVAEFAPAARQAVQPPPTTGAEAAGAAGEGRRRAAATSTTAPAASMKSGSSTASGPTTRVARSRACVGNPPRQTEDPQSPPCLTTIFEGDNGGATAKGVTETEILVAVPEGTGTPATVQLLFDYFNLRYEFYGRRLVPVVLPYAVSNAVAQRAAAEEIAAKGAFAALDLYMGYIPPAISFHQALAHHGVISTVGRDVAYGNEVVFDELHPYVWGVNPSVDEIWNATAELVCTALVGRPASHAGAALAASTRKFGVVVESQYNDFLPISLGHRRLVEQLQACGAAPEVAQVRQASGEDGRVAMAAFKGAGVTSVICACVQGPVRVATAATAVGAYEPELLLPNLIYSMEGTEISLQSATYAQHARHIFGVHQTVKLLPYQARPFFSAMTQMQPGFSLTSSDGGNFRQLESAYRQLMLLAAGIQGAGPTLTPDTFAAGLTSTAFPNPGAGQAPLWQPAVGFGPGDHTFYDDVALAWWSPALPSTVAATNAGTAGSWCFLGGGARFRPGEIPADADGRFFDPAEPCR